MNKKQSKYVQYTATDKDNKLVVLNNIFVNLNTLMRLSKLDLSVLKSLGIEDVDKYLLKKVLSHIKTLNSIKDNIKVLIK